MWDYEVAEKFARQAKWYEKKSSREYKAVLSNLSLLQKSLRAGANPLKLPFGFIHREQCGVVAIDQSKGGGNLAQTRLYVFLDPDTKTIHLITIGGKKGQAADVQFAAEYVISLRKEKERGANG